MFDTLHNIARKETEGNIAVSLSKIANALEAIALPYLYFAGEFEKTLKEKKLGKDKLNFIAKGETPMTNELEKQFFDTFGIEPKLKTFAIKQDTQGDLTYPPIYEYPQISDTHYLKLIAIMSKELAMIVNLLEENLEDLKSEILKKCVMYYHINAQAWGDCADKFKHQVRTLFEEG